MAGNTWGQMFRVSTFGESHGGAVGAVVDGCPAGLDLSEADIQPALDRRRPGQSSITTPRKEEDQIQILSGVFEGKTTGTPILLLAHNKDARSSDYHALLSVYRPGHADFTYEKKYGLRDWRGSGRASARETLARVAAGAIAQKYLRERCGVSFVSYVQQVGPIVAELPLGKLFIEDIEANMVRCPDAAKAAEMIALIEEVQSEGDSVGGVIRGEIRGVPAGLGEPVFDKLPAELGKAMLSINAVKGFEIGSGFAGVAWRGSQHNDAFGVDATGAVRPITNHAGGTLGGISTGELLYFRVAFKPVSTIRKRQETANKAGERIDLEAAGRHDPCVVPRAVPIVDAMAALVIMDLWMRHHTTARDLGAD
ncbi:chorismate synthase [Myxococcota bacterium]|nr:chorismate synthase [Myxococcota bacterium]